MNIFLTIFTTLSILVSSVVGVRGYNAQLEFNQEVKNIQERQTDYGQEISSLIEEYVTYAENVKEEVKLGATVQPIAGFSYTLTGAGISSSATSIILSSFTIPQTDQPIVDGDMSETFYLTLEPGNSDRQEIASCTTVAQNSNGTATLSGCSRGLSPIPDFSASTTLRFAHGGNTSVIFSDPPQLFNEFGARKNNELITGNWTFTATNTPQYNFNPAWSGEASTTFASKGYIDDISIAGASNATTTTTGIVRIATSYEAASGTPTTGVNPAKVISTDISSSTPGRGTNTTGMYAIFTELSGKINPFWISTSSAYEWTGTQFYSATSTRIATSTFAGASFRASTSSPLIFGNTLLNFKNTQMATGTVLSIDGNGGMSFLPQQWSLATTVLLSSAQSTTSITGIPVKRHVRVVVQGQTSGGNEGVCMQFNADTGTNYASANTVQNTPAFFSGVSKDCIPLVFSTGISNGVNNLITVNISNEVAFPKIVRFEATRTEGAAQVPLIEDGSGHWQNTSAGINQIDIGAGGTWSSGTRFSVYVSDF